MLHVDMYIRGIWVIIHYMGVKEVISEHMDTWTKAQVNYSYHVSMHGGRFDHVSVKSQEAWQCM